MANPEVICSISSTQPKSVLFAVQHVRKMTGKTQSHLMRASDGHLYITKFSNTPLGIRVLASEFLATKIGLFLGLPMPEVAVIEVPNSLIKDTPELQMETEDREIIRCAPGKHLAVRYAGDACKDRVLDHMPEDLFHRVTNQDDFLRVLPFDKWLCNCDHRQAVFVGRAGEQKYRAIFIDQHDCFDGERWRFFDKPEYGLYGGRFVYQGVTGWKSFEPPLSQIEQFSIDDLRRLASEIPSEWYEKDRKELVTLIDTLDFRRGIVRDLIEKFRYSEYDPFPRWKGNDYYYFAGTFDYFSSWQPAKKCDHKHRSILAARRCLHKKFQDYIPNVAIWKQSKADTSPPQKTQDWGSTW